MGQLIGITTGKGGAGKTTITESVATFINRYYNIDVAVIDADSQMSLYEDREADIRELKQNNPLYLKAYKELLDNGKDLYKIYKMNPEDIKNIAEVTNKHELTFIDIPGSLAVKGVPELLFFLDYSFIPFSGEKKAFRSHIATLNYIKKIKEHPKSRLKDFAVFINQYAENKNLAEQRALEAFFENSKMNVLKPFYYNIDLTRTKCSTVIPLNYGTTKKHLNFFVENLLEFINLKYV